MKRIDFSNIKITGGFWQKRQRLTRDVTVHAVYKRFKESGRFDAFKFDRSLVEPHFYWDSDVAKWIEGVAYLLKAEPSSYLEKIVDDLVEDIEKHQEECGYFNIYHTVVEPENRFRFRDHHELYCAGHLFEAAVAYYEATGKDKLLRLMCKYADYIEKRFMIDKDTDFVTPGHEEIELALVRLYECTGEKRYLELSKFFIDERGKRLEGLTDWSSEKYLQSHIPLREQKTAEGHAVRAVYIYCAMADLALKYGDTELKSACERIFDDIISSKLYITGGIGSSSAGEAFTVPYDLPNVFAYTESCAAIGLILFAHRMLLIDNDSKYSDVIERALYNGFLSSTSLDGKAFFYTNPLEIVPYLHTRDCSVTSKSLPLPITQRKELFECSCCPPNIVRFVPSMANLIYTCDDDTVYTHQFMQSEAKIEIGGGCVEITQNTAYPFDGKIEITASKDIRMGIRIPSWCDSYKGDTVKGYAYFDLKGGVPLMLDFEMKPRFTEANPKSYFNAGKVAVECGPIVYCMEGCDNGQHIRDIRLDSSAEFELGFNSELDVPTLSINALRRKATDGLYSPMKNDFEKIKATLIPYFAFANRGESEMQVWHFIK